MAFKKRVILLCLFFLLFFGIFSFFAKKIFFESVLKKEKEILDLKKREKEILKKLEVLKSYQKEKEKFELTKAFLFDPQNPLPFINFLEDLLKKENLDFEIKAGGKNNEFLISFSASFESFLNFLKKLERAPYFVKVKKIEISKEKGTILIEVLSTEEKKENKKLPQGAAKPEI